jgi:hypothetical protein
MFQIFHQMNTRNKIYKINHHYNANNAWMTFRPQHRQYSSRTTASVQQPSYRGKINTILAQWRQIQQEKKQCQQQQQKPMVQTRKQDDFDRIMEEDLENQLKELERQEEEQYKLMEQAIEEQLEQDHCDEQIDELEQQLKQIEDEEEERNDAQLKEYEEWEQLEQLYHLEQIETYQQQQQQSRKVIIDE